MKNFWTGFSDERLLKAELDAFIACGIDPESII